MKNLTYLIVLLFTYQIHAVELDKTTETYCQDLNVLYLKLNVITSNIVNINTTRTLEGGHYIKKIVTSCNKGFCNIQNRKPSPILKYEPDHPDAGENGYVKYPGYSLNEEQAKLEKWKRVYEAVIDSSSITSSFFLEDPMAQICLDKYPALAANHNFKKYLGR